MATRTQMEVGLHRKDAEWSQTIQKALDITAPAFYNDPLFAWMFLEASDELRHKKLWTMLRSVLRSALECGGFILEARGWGSIMAVSEPGQKYDGVLTVWRSAGVSATLSGGLMPTIHQRLLFNYLGAVDKAKAKVITGSNLRDCFYVLITATEPQNRKQGLLSAMTARLLEEARKVNKPVWLEATTKCSARQFTRFGFETVDEITVGKGAVNAQGARQAGGEGVTVTGMIWWPEGAKEKEKETKQGEAK
ncbi:hypothetical protein AK830_g12024 [Neonectria ditissima]|uniref:N-acetyltransferase domain-containing protein n=1 Tax=Neonectria ditissima TaxID=78410 RepID=A0A0P7B6C6_9HYPO|nr:hypothetical protein AK830_g12024 [Neonectria ditissima]